MGMLSERAVVYLMSYPAHAPYLATSLLSLRRHWGGTVRIFAWNESIDIARSLAGDPRIGAQAILANPQYRGKNDQFIHKIALMMQQDTGLNLYLDADTLVNGTLTEMFSNAQYFGFAATQFCDWDTSGGLIRGRLDKLREFPEIDVKWIDKVTTKIYSSVNGGVFSCVPGSPVLKKWQEWSLAAKSIFICDECVLHLMVPMFGPLELLTVMPGIFNSSPKYVSQGDAGRVRVWHGHGDCWVRPSKSREGWAMWSAALREARKLDIGGINGWFKMVNNKFLNELIENGDIT